MTGRINPFANLDDLPVFDVKPKPEMPVSEEAIAIIAEQHNFPSRQAPAKPPKEPKEPKRKRRFYTTGRNRQFNIKASSTTIDRFYRIADEKKIALCQVLEEALDALERVGDADGKNSSP